MVVVTNDLLIENEIHKGWTEGNLTRSTPGGVHGLGVLRKCLFLLLVLQTIAYLV